MLIELLYAVIQSITEFLPVSSSGHLALVSNLIETPNLFLFTALHLASLLAVIIFTRKEIAYLLSFKKDSGKLWLYLIIGTIPAVLIGLLLKDAIEASFSSFLFLGIAFIFTSGILFMTKYAREYSKLNVKNSLAVGLFQVLALFPGVSRSGTTISSGMIFGLNKEKAVKFSFLLFIPLALGAFILELGSFSFSYSILLAFIVAFILSLVFLNLLYAVVKKGKFWMFSIYCFILGIISLILYFK